MWPSYDWSHNVPSPLLQCLYYWRRYFKHLYFERILIILRPSVDMKLPYQCNFTFRARASSVSCRAFHRDRIQSILFVSFSNLPSRFTLRSSFLILASDLPRHSPTNNSAGLEFCYFLLLERPADRCPATATRCPFLFLTLPLRIFKNEIMLLKKENQTFLFGKGLFDEFAPALYLVAAFLLSRFAD